MSAPPADATLVVMYHYVRPPDEKNWGGIKPLAPGEFEAQLDWLASWGDIVPASALESPASGKRPRVVLTFDDGTADHYAVVFPILRRRGLCGLFAVISGPAIEGALPRAHFVHALLSKAGDEEVRVELERRFTPGDLGPREEAQRLYAYETAESRRLVK